MKKIKILEVNNIDLAGNRFNGYDMIQELSGEQFEIKQAVIIKQSSNNNVINILENDNQMKCFDKFDSLEYNNSIRNVFSITTPSLMELDEYKEADIIHFHMFHNTKLSIYSIRKIAKEKKVILSLHDPWFITGRCVHFYNCQKWKTGCENCQNLDSLFKFKVDNCNSMWNLKKQVFSGLDIDIVFPTKWMEDLVKKSPILKQQKHIHKLPFGLDYEKFRSVTNKEAREYYKIPNDHVVLFHRAQNEFKGTPYVLEALKQLNTKEKITILTCDNKHLLDDIKDKYNVIDLGNIRDEEMIKAMNACDIFLMPSIGESFGLMAVEAMACSKPVVVFDNSALPSVTYAPKCGYLVKNRDSQDLMKAIKKLVEDKKERQKRGKLGFEIVKREYTNEAYNKHLKEIYISVYNRNQNHQDISISGDEKNLAQLKYQLNDLTVMLFGTSSKNYEDLIYKNIKGRRKNNKKIKYDDLLVQEEIYNYCKKLNDSIKKHDIPEQSKKLTIEKAIYTLKNNPQKLAGKIINKIKRK